jgi:hypothetical protein
MAAKQPLSRDNWRFQPLVRGYLWTLENPADQYRCLLILWQSDSETWDASAVLIDCDSRVQRVFESHNSTAAGLHRCFAWLRQFSATYNLPPLEILEAWADMKHDSSAGTGDQQHRHGVNRLN